jgi:peptidoglycan-N-acetylglucosamine deacetylase
MTGLKRAIPDWLVRRRLSPTSRGILLTFDDGPDPDVTPAVLDRLRAFEARAVFFMVGRRLGRARHLPRRVAAEGHLLGNHGHRHRPMVDPFRLRRDLLRCSELLEWHAGVWPRLYRPPLGRLTPAGLVVPPALGLRTVTWSLDVRDWACRSAEDAGRAAAELLARVVARDIVLLHDDHAAVLPILDAVLPELARRFDLAAGVNEFA